MNHDNDNYVCLLNQFIYIQYTSGFHLYLTITTNIFYQRYSLYSIIVQSNICCDIINECIFIH